MTAQSDYDPAEIAAAMERFNKATRERTMLEEEWAPYVERLNAAKAHEQAAKEDLTDLLVAARLTTYGDTDFDVDVRTADRGSYDYQKLPAWVREVRGVCEVQVAVNREAVNRLVQRGKLAAEDATAAWQSKPIKPYLAIKPRVEG